MDASFYVSITRGLPTRNDVLLWRSECAIQYVMSGSKQVSVEVSKKMLDAVSPSFCLAKWTQVTIHLHNGMTHSCHHPKPHKIPLDELKDNPSALHNTKRKIQQRHEMLKGTRPSDCNYCWRVEDSPGNNISDRIYKSAFSWSFPFRDDVLKAPLSETFLPRNVELNIGDACNFKCSYCGPEISSRWMAEIKQHGAYPTSGQIHALSADSMPIPEDQHNPYVDAWWKWWPDLYPHLHTLRITGGEPLLNRSFYRTLDWICERPHPEMILGVNTNLCPPEDRWRAFLEQMRIISSGSLVKRVEIFTSAEAWGPRSDYIRHGMTFDLWLSRVWQLLEELPKVQLHIMATYNALSVTSFDQLLQEVLRLKLSKRLRNPDRPVPIFLDVSYLRYPEHQTVKVLPSEFDLPIGKHVQIMKDHQEQRDSSGISVPGFRDFEVQKMERVLNWFRSEGDSLDEPSKKEVLRKDFYRFFTEHDRRRGTDFEKTFPELSDFWNRCREEALVRNEGSTL